MSEVEKEQSEPAEQSNGAASEQNGADTDNGDPNAREQDIIRQIEYYFGDINLPKDKFLQEQLKLDDGWVPLDVLTKFHRLAKLSSDIAVIAAAIAKSTTGLIELSEDNKKLRRSPEVPLPELNEERRKALVERSLYVKGFPKDASVDLCLNYFAGHPMENIVMRRYLDRPTRKHMFKGSIFATFKTKEEAQKFIEAGAHKYEDTELIVKWQEDYLKEKKEAYQTMKEKKIEDQKAKKEEKDKHDSIKLPLGAQLHFDVSGEGLTREHIRDAATQNGGEVAFIDFNKGDKEGTLRLLAEGSAKTFLEKLDSGKLKVEETELSFRVLEGDEERAFLDKTAQEMANRRRNMNKNKFGRGRGGRHGGGNNRKRKQDPSTDGPANKIKATE